MLRPRRFGGVDVEPCPLSEVVGLVVGNAVTARAGVGGYEHDPVLGAGAAFMWPFWRVVENNRPRTYDPRHPPGELME